MTWTEAHFGSMGAPNDEVLCGHRLYYFGLRDAHWGGIIEESELIAELERQNSVHPRHNPARFDALVRYVLPLKESVVEIVASGQVEGTRREGDTLASATNQLRAGRA